MSVIMQVGLTAHLLTKENAPKVFFDGIVEKIAMAISEMAITIILLLTDKVQKVLTQTLFRE